MENNVRKMILEDIVTDNFYQGCGEYTLIFKDGNIIASLYGYPAEMVAEVEELPEMGDVIYANGSGGSFFIEDDKSLEKAYAIGLNVKNYDVPSADGGLHTNHEIILDE